MPASSEIITPDKADTTTISLPPDQQRLWLDIQARFQGIGLDGTWRQSYQLASSRLIRGLAFSCRLDPRVELDAVGHPYTSWIIPALETWIVPEDRDKVQFLPPSGTPIQFQINQITSKFDGPGLSAWKIRRTSENSFDLLSPNRSIWTYSHGLLKTISISNFERFAVQTDGGMIREVRRLSPVSADPLLSADYDEYGDPIRVNLGGPSSNTLYWDNGELREMKRGSGRAIVFTYFHGLISTIQVSGRPDVHLTWCENPHFSRGDSWWYAPVALRSDDSFDYRYSVTDEGYLIDVTNRASRNRSTMLFNPMRHKLLQHDSFGHVFLVTFKDNGAGTSPERVETLVKLTHW